MKKGYRFVGTNLAGNDAFFVREDYAGRFVDNSIQHIRCLPSRFRESRDRSGCRTYLGGVARLTHISTLSVINIETGASVRLADLGPIYSDEWLSTMAGETGNS